MSGDGSLAAHRIGIALGGGAARGLCHIGVLRTLKAHGIVFPTITGTSMGAIIGAAYACGKLDEVEKIALSVTARTMAGWADVNLGTGALRGDAVKDVFRAFTGDTTFADLRDRGISLAVVASDLERERAVYIDEGRVDDAVRASMSIPGVFEPVVIDGRALVDGGLFDNVPVDAARGLGADRVVAVEVYNPHDVWTRAALSLGQSVIAAKELRARLGELVAEEQAQWQRSFAAYRKAVLGMLAAGGGSGRGHNEFFARLHLGPLARGGEPQRQLPWLTPEHGFHVREGEPQRQPPWLTPEHGFHAREGEPQHQLPCSTLEHDPIPCGEEPLLGSEAGFGGDKASAKAAGRDEVGQKKFGRDEGVHWAQGRDWAGREAEGRDGAGLEASGRKAGHGVESRDEAGVGWTALRAALAALDIVTSVLESGREPFRGGFQADLLMRPDVRPFHAHQFYRASRLIAAGDRAAMENLPAVMRLVTSNRR